MKPLFTCPFCKYQLHIVETSNVSIIEECPACDFTQNKHLKESSLNNLTFIFTCYDYFIIAKYSPTAPYTKIHSPKLIKLLLTLNYIPFNFSDSLDQIHFKLNTILLFL